MIVIKSKSIGRYTERGALSLVDKVDDNWLNWNVNTASIASKSGG